MLIAHCHNIHGIAPHGARHVIETAAYAHISLSAVVKRGSLETRTLVKVIWLWNTNLSYSETLLHSESEKVFSESKYLTNQIYLFQIIQDIHICSEEHVIWLRT